jgi:hypothetical protein
MTTTELYPTLCAAAGVLDSSLAVQKLHLTGILAISTHAAENITTAS